MQGSGVILVVGLLLSGALLAQPKGDARAEARKSFEAGRHAYNVGKFDEALAHFERAYELRPAPLLLFNMGQCHRQMKNWERAVFFLDGYLREDPKTADRAVVEQLIAEARRELEREGELVRRAGEIEAREQELARQIAELKELAQVVRSAEESATRRAEVERIQRAEEELARLRADFARSERERAEGDLDTTRVFVEEEEARARARNEELSRIVAGLDAVEGSRPPDGGDEWILVTAAGSLAALVVAAAATAALVLAVAAAGEADAPRQGYAGRLDLRSP